VVKKLITVDHVFILHGGSCTAAIAAALDYVNREKVPMVMLNAAGDNAVFPPTRYVFGSFPGDPARLRRGAGGVRRQDAEGEARRHHRPRRRLR